MANTPQSKKRIRRNAKRTDVNTARVSRVRSFVKKVEAAIDGGDKKAAAEALKAAQPELARGVARGVLHKNTASRKLSRLSKRFAAVAARVARNGIGTGPVASAPALFCTCEVNRRRGLKKPASPAIRATVIQFLSKIQRYKRKSAPFGAVNSLYFSFFTRALLHSCEGGSKAVFAGS